MMNSPPAVGIALVAVVAPLERGRREDLATHRSEEPHRDQRRRGTRRRRSRHACFLTLFGALPSSVGGRAVNTTRASRNTRRSRTRPPSCPGSRCRSRSTRSRAPRRRRARSQRRAQWGPDRGAAGSSGARRTSRYASSSATAMMQPSSSECPSTDEVLGGLAPQHERRAAEVRSHLLEELARRASAESGGRSRSSRPTATPLATNTANSPNTERHRSSLPEEQPREQREARRGGDGAAEVVAPERRAHDHDGDREQPDRDLDPAPSRHAPREQCREQHRRGGELGERQVALAHEADADRRRVPEHGVPLEVRAGQRGRPDGARPRSRARPGSRRPAARRVTERAHDRAKASAMHDDERPVRRQPLRGGRSAAGPRDTWRSSSPSSDERAEGQHPAHRRRNRSTSAAQHRQRARHAQDHAHRHADQAVAEQAVLVHVRPGTTCGRRASRRSRRSPSGAPPWRQGGRCRTS